jgi:hypothetical protein
MKSKSTISTRLSLVLILTIASSLVANAAQAESRQERPAKEEISRTITELVGLGADRQWLVVAALNRANTAVIRQSGASDGQGPVIGGASVPGVRPGDPRQPNNSRR